MSDVNNLPLPIGSSIVDNPNRSENKGVRGGQNPICITTRLILSFRISSLSFIYRV